MPTSTPTALNLCHPPVHIEKGWLDLDRGILRTDTKPISLTPIEVTLLRVLLQRQGQPVSRDTLHAEVWGYHPRVLTRAADQTVKRLRKKLEIDPTNPTHLQTAHGVGYRFLMPETPSPPIATDANPVQCPNNLNHAIPSLIGRQGALDRLDRWLESDSRLATLLGPGGIGKTATAKAWAETLLDAGPKTAGGIWFSDLVGIDINGMMMARIAIDLGLKMGGTVTPANVGEALSARGQTLLILDNVDPLVSVSRHVLTGWLQQAPRLRILLTSTVKLGVSQETCIELKPLKTRAAAQLLKRHLDTISGREHNPADIAQLAHALEGIPLAIELAASRCNLLSLPEIQARLDHRLDLLTRTGAEPTGRHRTLRACLAVSWNLLAPHEKCILRQATVFQGGFDMEAAESVLVVESSDHALLGTLQALRDHSLLYVQVGPGSTRIDMLEYIRDFVSEQIPAQDEPALWERHARHFVARCDQALGDNPIGNWCANESLTQDLKNFRVAADRASSFPSTLGVAVLLARARAIFERGMADESVRLCRQALKRTTNAEAFPAHLLSTTWRRVGRFTRSCSGPQEGKNAIQRAIDIADEHELHRLAILGRLTMVQTLYEGGQFEQAQSVLDQNRPRVHTYTPDMMPLLEFQQARILAHRGVIDDAKKHAQLALGMWCQQGNRQGEALAHHTLGYIALEAGDDQSAQSEFEAAIEAFEEHGDDRAASLYSLLGVVALQQGQLSKAKRILDASVEWCKQAGRLQYLAEDLMILGQIALLENENERAHQHLKTAVELLSQGSNPPQQFEGQLLYSLALSRVGKRAAANARIAQCKNLQSSKPISGRSELITLVQMLVELEFDTQTTPRNVIEYIRQSTEQDLLTSTAARMCIRLAEAKMDTDQSSTPS